MALDREPIPNDKAFQALVATPGWRRVRRALAYRQAQVAKRALTAKNISEAQIAAEQREYQLLDDLLQRPVEFFTKYDHQQELSGHSMPDPEDPDNFAAEDVEETEG